MTRGARANAMAVVADTYGVRIVDDRASLVARVDDYYWMAVREDGRIRLKGFAPNEDIRKTVYGMAAAGFPGLEIDDRMRVARGGPSEDAWLSGVNFAFKQLGHLNSGRARLDETDFTIVGEARDMKSYNLLDQALNSGIPRGLKLKLRKIKAPKVSPFTWAAAIREGQLVLNGYVPNAQARTDVLSHAKAKFAGLKIVDQLTIASGAPGGWLDGARVGLSALSRLGNGQASMSDARLRVTGATKQSAMPAGVRDIIKAGLPRGFANVVDISVIKTAPVNLAWRAVLTKSSIMLEGDVPDRATNALLIERARRNFPGRRVINRMNIKSVTSPEGWNTTSLRSLDVMTRLSEGEATLNGKLLRLSGTALSVFGIETIRETVTSYLPKGFTGYEFVKPPAEKFSNYDFTETEEDGDSWWRNFLARTKPKVVAPIVTVKDILASKTPVAADVCGEALNEVVRTGVVRFETNSARINSASNATLQTIVGVAKKCPAARFEISGHTDSDGSAGYNQNLSLKRAKSIVAYLVGKGVLSSRLTSAGFGETRPIAKNDTDANKARNRRIEFQVLKN